MKKCVFPDQLTPLQSRKCEPAEDFSTPFSFKGNVIDHQFSGPGKFKLGKVDPLADNTDGVCVDVRKFFGESIVNITGNFKVGLRSILEERGFDSLFQK